MLAPRLIKITGNGIGRPCFVSFDIVLFLNRLAFDAERWPRSCIKHQCYVEACTSRYTRRLPLLIYAADSGLLCFLVPVRVYSSAARYISSHQHRSTANTTLGRTHERPHVKDIQHASTAHPHRIASQRIRCYVNNLSLFLPSHPICTGRCLFHTAAPPAKERWFAASTSAPYLSPRSPHTLSQATRCGCGCSSTSRLSAC